MNATPSSPIPAGPPEAPGARALLATPPDPLPWPGADPGRQLVTRLAAWRESAWFPVIGRAAALGAVFAALGSVGAISVALGLPDHNELPPGFAVAKLAVPWLAPARAGGADPAQPAAFRAFAPTVAGPPGPGPVVEPASALSAAPGAADSAEAPAPPPGSAGSASPAPVPSAEGGAAQTPTGLTPDGKVILNQAGLGDLTRLPGVGPKRAEAILALRERLGRFRRPTDLLRVRGIGPATLQKMQPHFVLDPPPPSTPSPP